MPTIIDVTCRDALRYFGGSRVSGVGSMRRVGLWLSGDVVDGKTLVGGGRGVTGAGFAKMRGLERCWGEGATVGLRGRGMVVVRGVCVCACVDAGVGADVCVEGVGAACGAAAVVGGVEGGGIVGFAADCGGIAVGIEVLEGVAGVGCDGIAFSGDDLGCDKGAFSAPAGFLVLDVVPVVADAVFNVPVFFTCSNILLAAGVVGVGCCGDATVLGASFFTVVFFAGAFFSFFASTSFCLGAGFAFPTAAFFTSATGTVSASSATTFFGRPRFLAGGGSVAGVDGGILATQLAWRSRRSDGDGAIVGI